VLNHLSRDLGHIRYLSCEDIKIFPEKSDEHEFLFRIQLRTDTKLLVGVVGVHRNLLICGSLFILGRQLIGGWLV
jgi:hypothetical protein